MIDSIDKLLNPLWYGFCSVRKSEKGDFVRKPCKNVDRIGVRLNQIEYQKLMRLAAGRNLSDVIRSLILEKETKQHD